MRYLQLRDVPMFLLIMNIIIVFTMIMFNSFVFIINKFDKPQVYEISPETKESIEVNEMVRKETVKTLNGLQRYK